MRYTLDLEFLEIGEAGSGSIIPISIAVVSEDPARFMYVESSDFNWDLARDHNPWLLENVQPYLYGPEWEATGHEISRQLKAFFDPDFDFDPKMIGYFADYDWVCFCWFFGRMIDLPAHLPKFCLDIKQEMEGKGLRKSDLPTQLGTEHNALDDARWMMQVVKKYDMFK